VAEAEAAYLIADILSDNEARSAAFGAESSLRFDFPVACKTGTSSDFRDNWAFGYTPEFTVGVWTGNADGSPMHDVSGVAGAAPILHTLFDYLHQHYGTSWYAPPTNLVECRINPITGKRLRERAPLWTLDSVQERFLADNLPPLETPEDYAPPKPAARAVRLGGEYREWLATGDNWLGDRAVLAEAADGLRILFPPTGTTLYLDGDLAGEGRRLYLRAAGPEQLEWHSDSLTLAREGAREVARLTEGRHQITVRDPASGAEARTLIEVKTR
jgi:penicillin-binding protein 1C